eukprot:CAMPEP_0181036566 /NCGR_PEP_ID=MMETSP1070-20121207/8930_1 /TAXON_ID=265543 /ORGANISM="Minutocellus polymorphus, Strain NH13" /LENGTH=30 /DNA_ID= /DNA_START= /DNA_END= /DNA_ORIENTATION=
MSPTSSRRAPLSVMGRKARSDPNVSNRVDQ